MNSVFLPKKDQHSPMLLFLSEFNTDPNQLQERNMKRGKEELNQSDLDKVAELGAALSCQFLEEQIGKESRQQSLLHFSTNSDEQGKHFHFYCW